MTTPPVPAPSPRPDRDGAAASQPPCPKAAGAVTCRHCVDFLLDFLEGRLTTEEQATFDAHLGLCADCAAYLEHYRRAVAAAAASGRDPGDAGAGEVPPGLVEAILAARRKPS